MVKTSDGNVLLDARAAVTVGKKARPFLPLVRVKKRKVIIKRLSFWLKDYHLRPDSKLVKLSLVVE